MPTQTSPSNRKTSQTNKKKKKRTHRTILTPSLNRIQNAKHRCRRPETKQCGMGINTFSVIARKPPWHTLTPASQSHIPFVFQAKRQRLQEGGRGHREFHRLLKTQQKERYGIKKIERYGGGWRSSLS
ncbi:hypothetical protein CDAR_18611 [Caerostris darwini]|uniref:Uncharacterized protein n=1 Tax=Caerostris darwini TaxID=1538125 RepID=A0AAV4V9Z3_9ARAC|nr:hypothetical protein CDAR_18611 [Caerostris darwini]